MEKGPVFIAGLERSGTSLIYALLASHPRIAMTRRTNLWTYFYNQYGDISQPENFERCLGMMMKYKRLVVLKPDADELRQEFWQGEPTYGRLFSLLEQQYARRVGKPRWGDKSLNTERYAEPIFAAYPGAKILHMMRDPRDRFASVMARWKFRRGGVGAGIAMWLSSANLAEENRQRYPNQYKIIRYETLATKPEETLREICAFIHEEYAPEMLAMHGAKSFREQGSNSSYGQRKPGVISTDSIGRFRQVLSQNEIAFIQAVARDEMLALSYQMHPTDLSMNDRLRYTMFDWPFNQARLIAWRIRYSISRQTKTPLPAYRIVAEPNTS